MENQILELAKTVLAETEVYSVLDHAMDQLIQLSGAERGMVILFDQKGEPQFETARNLEKKDIENPGFEVSRTIIDGVKVSGNPISMRNALDNASMKGSSSTIRLKILSVICLPLVYNKETFTGITPTLGLGTYNIWTAINAEPLTDRKILRFGVTYGPDTTNPVSSAIWLELQPIITII